MLYYITCLIYSFVHVCGYIYMINIYLPGLHHRFQSQLDHPFPMLQAWLAGGSLQGSWCPATSRSMAPTPLDPWSRCGAFWSSAMGRQDMTRGHDGTNWTCLGHDYGGHPWRFWRRLASSWWVMVGHGVSLLKDTGRACKSSYLMWQ